jgi:hypothetical protein
MKSNFLNEFLWSCAGANKEILRKYPSEWAKYAGVGGTILFTAIMAMISGGYAFLFVFNNYITAGIFSVFWALLIFNLDRYIVNSMGTDGTDKLTWKKLGKAAPRIIMAIFIGLVIATPLEMKIFEDRINSQLVKDNIERTNETRLIAQEGNRSLVERRNLLEREYKDITDRLAAAARDLKEEEEGSSLSGKMGKGPIYEAKKKLKEDIEKEQNDWKDAHELELKDIREQITANMKKTGDDIKKGNEEEGFCVRYEALSNLTSIKFKPHLEIPKLFWVSFFITFLFVSIECAPTLMRMMVADGSYEKILEAEKHRIRVMSDKRISDLNDIINTEIQISTEKNRQKLEAEVLANKELMEKIAKTQAELLQTAIDKWREEELAKINENPSAYIKTNNA